MYKRWLFKLTVLFICFLLISCSGTYRSYKDSLAYAFSPTPDLELTKAQVTESFADLAYFRRGDQRQITLALAFVEQGEQKWVSADNVVFVLKHGRLVRTNGFENDLLHVTSELPDPVEQGISVVGDTRWHAKVDWASDEYGYPVTSLLSAPKADTLFLLGQQFEVLRVEETLTYQAPSSFWRVDRQWQNVYWFDMSSGQLLKTRQRFSPNQLPMEFTFLSRAVRLMTKEVPNASI